MLYTVYLPKKKGTSGTIVKWLEYYSELTDFRNNIIMAPGYLSESENRIHQYLDLIKNEMYPNSSVKIGILNGMNGHHIIKGGNSVLECYEKHVDAMKNADWIKLKSNGIVDHRKVMVFYSEISNIDSLQITNDKEIDAFLDSINVNAILLGSSNQSFTTYFDRISKKGEADIFMMIGCSRTKTFPTIKSMLRDIRDSVYEYNTKSESDNLSQIVSNFDMNTSSENEIEGFLNDRCTVSVGFAGHGKDDSEVFLKEILKNVLEDGIL